MLVLNRINQTFKVVQLEKLLEMSFDCCFLLAFTGIETQNKFQIKNSMGQQIYFAAEESGFCTRQCCGPHRGFIMHIADNTGRVRYCCS